MKIALCHLDLSCGPLAQNVQKLELAVQAAGQAGADWVITPETALQGYYFYKINPQAQVTKQPCSELAQLRSLCRQYKLHLFLGCGEYNLEKQAAYNACLVFNHAGEICGRQYKNFNAGSAEHWATVGDNLKPVFCDGVSVGTMVCADAWFDKNSASLLEQGSQIFIDIAAWPPTEVCGNPLVSWLNVSMRTGLPFVVCNQTGSPQWMDMTVGESVVITEGRLRLSYSGKPAVLLFDYDFAAKKLLSQEFMIIKQ